MVSMSRWPSRSSAWTHTPAAFLPQDFSQGSSSSPCCSARRRPPCPLLLVFLALGGAGRLLWAWDQGGTQPIALAGGGQEGSKSWEQAPMCSQMEHLTLSSPSSIFLRVCVCV